MVHSSATFRVQITALVLFRCHQRVCGNLLARVQRCAILFDQAVLVHRLARQLVLGRSLVLVISLRLCGTNKARLSRSTTFRHMPIVRCLFVRVAVGMAPSLCPSSAR